MPNVEWDLGVMKCHTIKWSLEAAKTWVEFKATHKGSKSMYLAKVTSIAINSEEYY